MHTKIVEKAYNFLVVEDHPMIQKIHVMLLQDLGYYQVSVAGNGQTALQLHQDHIYNAILLDIGLPDINGIEVAKIIRAREIGTRQTPIIVVTAHTGSDIKEKCLEEGVNCVIHKPIDKEILTTILSRLLLVCA